MSEMLTYDQMLEKHKDSVGWMGHLEKDLQDLLPTPPTLEGMLGGLEPVGNGFFIRSPKLRQQKAMLRLQSELQGANSEIAVMDGVAQILQHILYREGDTMETYRQATLDEIEAAFSFQELMKLLEDFAGLQRNEKSGN